MNERIGKISSIVNSCAVVGFALSMVFDFSFGAYFSSMFIAFSFVPMISAFVVYGKKETKVAGNTAMLFASMYATFILIIYFVQLTTVRVENLSVEAILLLDYAAFGMFFNLNLLGYGLMSLSTFFIGITIDVKTKAEKWLKYLLMIHGIFAISGLIMPMLDIFQTMEGVDWVGTGILLFWCVYFTPIGILSYEYFKREMR